MKDRYAKMEEALVGTGESRSERQAQELAELKRQRQWFPPSAALDEIHHLKAENTTLHAELQRAVDECIQHIDTVEHQRAEIERLQRERDEREYDDADMKNAHDMAAEGVEKNLSFVSFRRVNLERAKCFPSACQGWILAQWSNACLGELGEAANIIKKLDRGDFTLDDVRQDLADELSDAFTYLDHLAFHAGIDLGEAVAHKFNVVSARRGLPHRLPVAARTPESQP